MDHPSGKKLFSAEKQRMKTTGTAYIAAATGAESDAILAAIAALQGDVHALDQYVRSQGGEAAAPEPPPAPEAELQGKEEVKLLRTEIRAMSLAIHQTKTEIAALRPHNSEDDRLMVVTQELDAIVTASRMVLVAPSVAVTMASSSWVTTIRRSSSLLCGLSAAISVLV